ncbi:helix-turn-helix domain-containing protein [Nonomuraea sp. NPDC050451]|uniref:helix-turn-helix domain-containing protein n=1 Tax=Nonomuraea sp. NPDC050451 TaxID=3364364 RepID=UPI0037B3ABE4
MAIARSRGKLKGKQPKLTARQQAELVRMHATGDYTIADLMEVFSIGRATLYRTKTMGTTSAGQRYPLVFRPGPPGPRVSRRRAVPSPAWRAKNGHAAARSQRPAPAERHGRALPSLRRTLSR